LTDPKTNETFALWLGQYIADDGHDGYTDHSNNAEGAYLFKPNISHQYEMYYGGLDNTVMFNETTIYFENDYIQTMQLYLTDRESDQIRARVRVTYNKCGFGDFAPIEVDVEMNSIEEGIDAVVNFEFQDGSHNGTFYTDSNGLEMQTRQIDYRPSWPFGEYEPGH
jgi:hypothetical protein